MLYITLALVAIVVFLLFRFFSIDLSIFEKMGIETPPTNRFLGNFGLAIKLGIFDVQTVFYSKFKHKKVYGWYDFRRPTMIVKDLDVVKEILVKHFSNFVDRPFIFKANPPFSETLVFLQGERWKHVRSVVSPTFSSSRLKKMSGHVVRNAKVMLENVRQMQESGQEVELREFASCFTLDVIASTGFGLEMDTLKNPKNRFATEAKNVFNPNPFLYVFLLLVPELSKWCSKLGLPLLPQKSMEYFAQVVDAAIEGRKKEGTEGKVNDFLDLMMNAEERTESHKELTRTDVHAQAITFIFASYDTTATVMSFTLFMLAMHPELCQRVQAEVDDRCGQNTPDYENVQSLSYLDMFINETVRLYPPGGLLHRKCVKEIEIQGIRFPKDMMVVVPMYAFHTDPDIWPEPDKFDPERFTQENKDARHPYAHMPFGQGPRNCVGQRLALLVLKVAIATVVQRYTPTACSKSVYPVHLSKLQAKATDGLWVKFETRRKPT
ncbi:cytochrome P450 3A16-like isoform X2 [Physella acuta]|uniref:cytochrome P450 3A16-like isoform X2 n=1 Tax=Physella acuta TaxID=109671 RepID=UPI0027DBAFB5|nr:cytochrome P450 3A16-like isoform X2 [Physella acuta]XP_059167040.1 cytochrome P450 3A16-like isoform X2 [Physella acuta]XP_059167048.1 cytochrome P450 3A16-like isoform X2 [Physella acuta]